MEGADGGAFLAGRRSGNSMSVPVMMPLLAPGSQTDSLAVVKMTVSVISPGSSCLVLKPSATEQLPLGGLQSFVWTVAGAQNEEEYVFRLSLMKASEATADGATNDASGHRVHGKVLSEIPGTAQTVSLMCAPRAVAGMSAEEAPCSFEHALAVGVGGHCSPGDVVVVLLQWTLGGQQHEMLSPGFEVVSVAARRLSAPARRLWSQDAWNARISQHKKSCSEKDLHFELGAGILVRGRVDSLGVPEDFPMIGNSGDTPELSTGYRRIAAIKPGTDARDLLPSAVCTGGLCRGALPGCRESSFKKMHFPVIVFNHSRPFHYTNKTKGKFHGAMKEALAYAFSVLPEVLDVAIRELNETGHAPWSKETSTTTTTGSRAFNPAAPPQYTPRTRPSFRPPPPTAAPRQSTTEAPYYKRWWDGRRLFGLEGRVGHRVGPSVAKRPEPLEEHQVSVRFREGVPYAVDGPLIDMMLRHGYFMDVEDDAATEQGPLQIISFRVDGSLDDAAGSGVQDEAGALPAPWFVRDAHARTVPWDVRSPAWVGGILSFLGCVCAAAAVAGGRWRLWHLHAYTLQSQHATDIVE
mmetsp:Transcript_132164/g.368408  ORF Transcript_132164/g.368408 Transcript_132164/m.368408 type:complete len:579 (+) Transcript_132164:2-1738(+)